MSMTQDEFTKRYRYDPAKDKLGEGGFGDVFKAYDTYRDRWVALKISKIQSGYENVRLKKEVEMVSALRPHPNIAYYEECYTFPSFDAEYDFGVLQYYEEGNLIQLLKKQPLSFAEVYSILRQVLSGLEFLHGQEPGIIHRDLKPQNILMVKRQNGEYVPKITDFGISKKLDMNKSSIFTNSLAGAGTLAYASPEQLKEKDIRRNADLWSFGVIAYQALTGELPFNTGEHSATSELGRGELFRQIKEGRMPDGINQIAEPWQGLIRRCLVTDPDERIKSAPECFELLDGKGGAFQSQPQPAPPKPKKPPEDLKTSVDVGTIGTPKSPNYGGQSAQLAQSAQHQLSPKATDPFQKGGSSMTLAYCPSCGAQLQPGARFCLACGQPVQATSPPVSVPQMSASQSPNYGGRPAQSTQHSRITAAILALLLGYFGAHKFYLGKTGLGLVYLLFSWTLIVGVISIIEGIIYLTISDEEFAAKYVKQTGR